MVFPRPKDHPDSAKSKIDSKVTGRNSPPSRGICGIADLKMNKPKKGGKEDDEPENGGFKLDVEAAAAAAMKREPSINGGSPKSTQSRGVDTASSAPVASISAIGTMMVDGTKKAGTSSSAPAPGFGIGGVLIGMGEDKSNVDTKGRRQTNRKVAAIFGLATALVLVAVLCGLLFFVYARHRCEGGIGGPFEALFGGSSSKSEPSKGLKFTKKYYGSSSNKDTAVPDNNGDSYQSDQSFYPQEPAQSGSSRFNRPPKTNEPFLQKRLPPKTSTTSTTTTSRTTSSSSPSTTAEADSDQPALSRAENFVMTSTDAADWQPSNDGDAFPQRRPPYRISNSHQGVANDESRSISNKPIYRFRT